MEQFNFTSEVLLTQLLHCPAAIVDAVGILMDANAQAEEIFFLCPKNQFIGKRLQSFIADESVCTVAAPLVECQHQYYFHPITKKGYYLSISAVPSVASAQFYVFQVHEAIDQAYEVLKNNFDAMLNNLPGSVYWKDTESRYLGCNKVVAKMAGYEDPQEVVGKTDYDLCWHEFAEEWQKHDRLVMQSDEQVVREESARLASGDVIVELSYKTPLKDRFGKVLGIIGTSLDITPLKKMETALIEAKVKAEVANKAKEQFLYNMRHDIRTPFAGISGLVEILQLRETDPQKLEYLSALQASSDSLLTYLNEILELTQIEDGNVPIVSRLLDLKEVAQHCADMYLPAIQEANLAFIFDYDSHLPENLFTDEFRLKRILINLIGNAVKFTPTGSIHLKIYLSGEKPDSDEILVAISVKDTGIGIPKDKQIIIFEKFERLTPSYQGKYKGSGLGLFAVRTLIDELKGEIDLKSDEGQGADFTCMIPMKRSKHTHFQPPKKEPVFQSHFSTQDNIEVTSHYAGAEKQKKPRILLVEDMIIIQTVTTQLFESLDCSIDVADSGEKALELFASKNYDLILMDIGLPVMDGFEATQRIRATEKGKTIPILAVTAHAVDEVQDRCNLVGMNAIIQKPLHRDKASELLKIHYHEKSV